ncbi:MAG: biotin-dependent carboxyltransferase family protein [Cyclobacteriaceae bacterium]
MNKLTIVSPGAYTSIQDLGRFGYRHLGVPLSGAMDQQSAKLANLLVNNAEQNPVIEVTLSGPKIQFDSPTIVAITGAHISPTLNGSPVTMNHKIEICENDTLAFGKVRYGVRCYIGVHGLESDLTLNSTSQYEGITLKGRLEKGDSFNYKTANSDHSFTHVKTDPTLFGAKKLEITPGPDFDLIPKKEIKGLLDQTFQIHENNRMGYRLECEKPFINSLSIITSNVIPGTVQLTPSGQLIVLMRDAQVTGGYPRIFQLTDKAINQLAQLPSGYKLWLTLK